VICNSLTSLTRGRSPWGHTPPRKFEVKCSQNANFVALWEVWKHLSDFWKSLELLWVHPCWRHMWVIVFIPGTFAVVITVSWTNAINCCYVKRTARSVKSIPPSRNNSGICKCYTCLHLLGIGTTGDSFDSHRYWPCRNIPTESGKITEWGRDRQSK